MLGHQVEATAVYIKVRGWDLADVDLELKPPNVVIGANGSGKTSLLAGAGGLAMAMQVSLHFGRFHGGR